VRIEISADGPLVFVAYISGKSVRAEAGHLAPPEIPGGDALLAALGQVIPQLSPLRLLHACRAVGVMLSKEDVPVLWRRGTGLPALAERITENTTVPVANPMAAPFLSFRGRAGGLPQERGPGRPRRAQVCRRGAGPQASLFLHRARSVAVLLPDKPDLLAVFPDR
jgi:hypothetical protein